MLVEIQSEAFKEKGKVRPKIVFHKGLNTITASESANNSTGKTSFLLAVDFAFGGSSYAEERAKIVTNIGHHTVNFAFEFSGTKEYYSRDTADKNKVAVCDSNYLVQKIISLDDFTKHLAEKYGLEDKSLTFRNAVNPYFRISHKSNKSLSDVLKAVAEESPRIAVINLEKLFNRFYEIENEKEQAEDKKKAAETFKDAVKRKFITSSIETEADFKKAQEKLKNLKEELSAYSKSSYKNMLSLDDTSIEKITAAEQKYKKAGKRKAKLENRIALAKRTIEGFQAPTSQELSVLESFFPGVNLQKVCSIEKFHESLSEVLTVQIEDEIQVLSMQLRAANADFEAVKNEYKSILPDGEFTEAAFKTYGKKYLEIQKLAEDIENYKKGKILEIEEETLKTNLNEKEISILNSIAQKINENMARLNTFVNEGQWKNPVLTFNLPKTKKTRGISSYSLESENDAGDGTKSANAIMFDLSVLYLTKLPAVVHDLFVRNELDDERDEDCIKVYALEKEKQIFTVFRSVKNYSPQVKDIIEENCVLNLYMNGGELYGTSSWIKKQ